MIRLTCLLTLLSGMLMVAPAHSQVLGLWLTNVLAETVRPAEDALPDEEEVSDADTTGWETSLVGRIGGSQTGFHNWAEGGVNALSMSSTLMGKASSVSNAWRQTHESRMAIGAIKQSGTELRKAEDVIRLGSSLQYHGQGFFRTFSPTLALTLRTQFWEGYNYDRNPIPGSDQRPPVKVSDFFSPATLTESIGLTYKYGRWFTQRLGLGGKQTFVAIPRLRALHGVDPGSIARYQIGIESRTDVDREIFTNVHLKSTLGLFAAFNNPELPDMLWENSITMKVNSWLGVNFEFSAFYDRDVSPLIQIKEVLSVGVTVVIV
jgi:hypothetical protein